MEDKDKRINGIDKDETIEIIEKVEQDSEIAEKRSREILEESIDKVEKE